MVSHKTRKDKFSLISVHIPTINTYVHVVLGMYEYVIKNLMLILSLRSWPFSTPLEYFRPVSLLSYLKINTEKAQM